MDPLGTKIIVLISEASISGGCVFLYDFGAQSSVLINKVSLCQGCPLREVPLFVIATAWPGARVGGLQNRY